MTHGTPQALQY